MESRELRIGNWVKSWDGKADEQWTLLDFKQIEEDTFIEPIPLTEEWLVRLGFRNLDHSGIRVGYDLVISDRLRLLYRHLDTKVTLRFHDSSCEVFCEYVHQLQNLYYALTGEELQYV